MISLPSYSSLVGYTEQQHVFDYFLSSLTPTVHDFDYLQNCDGAQSKISHLEEGLSDFCGAMSSPDWPDRLLELLQSSSTAVKIGRKLLAYRKPNFARSAPDSEDGAYELFDLANPTDLLKVLIGTKVIHFLEGTDEESLRHLLLGIELGLDSNARKNRGGHAMEKAVAFQLSNLKKTHPIEFHSEKNPRQIIDLGWATEDQIRPFGNKRFDFVVRHKGKTSVIETNYYSSGGSKLKSTAEEYIQRGQEASVSPVNFIWITDGDGWKSTRIPLCHAHQRLDFVLNLALVKGGALLEALTA